jgi:uridine kinase
MNLEEFAKYIVDYCKDRSINKLYICGNGGSGKTTLSYSIEKEACKYGNVNIISTDDFLISTELRKNSTNKWVSDGKEYSYRYTSSNKDTYFIRNIEEIIYNIDHKVDTYYFPRYYETENNIRQLHSNYFLTVIEGVGTVFLKRENALSIFLKCNEDTERERRAKRVKESNCDSIELYDELRTKQFENNVLIHESEFDMIVNTDNNIYEIVK